MVPSGLLGILVAIAITGYVQGNYFVVSPNKFRPDKPYEVDVSYTGTEGSPTVEVSLGIQASNPLDSKTESLVNGYKRVTLQIPSFVPEGTYTLTVVGSAGGQELFRNSTIVATEHENSLIFIQTDKPIYKPLETVRFRVVCVGLDLKAKNEDTNISIFDQNDNKLEEWLGVQSQTGVIEKSYKLSDLPPLGKWRIQVKNKVAMNMKEFSVEKYVLPKFDVKIETVPKLIVSKETQELKVKVTTKYTYGKAVLGKAKFIFGSGRSVKTVEATLQGNEDGTHTQMFDVSELVNYKEYRLIRLSVNVTEEATQVTQSSDEITVPWYEEKIEMEFLPTSSKLFRPGLAVDLELKVKDIVTGGPAHVSSTVEIEAYFNERVVQRLQVDNQGIVSTSFDVPADYSSTYGVSFNAKLQKSDGKNYYYANWFVKPYRAKLNTMLTVEITETQPIEAGATISLEIQSTAVLQQVAYMVLARGMVADSGKIDMPGTSKTHVITTNKMMSPGATVFVYGIVSNGKETEVIADSVGIKVVGVFSNEVTLNFNKANARPGDTVDVTLTSEGESSYYILAVDESVLLLGTGNDLTQSEVTSEIKKFNLGETPSYNDGPEPHGGGVEMRGDVIFPGGGNNNEEPTSAGEILKKRGLVYLSGIYVEKSPPENELVIMEAMADGGVVMRKNAEDSAGPQPMPPPEGKTEFAAVGRVRKSFPEAWMWKEGRITSTGTLTFTETVPDTITDWVATAFAISDEKGLAITQHSSQLRAFQPFFVSLALPYAIKRGEIFQLRVSISNYLTTTTPVRVTLKKSDQFGIVEKNNSGEEVVVYRDVVTEVQVKPNVPAGVMFKIAAQQLGYVKLNVIAAPDASTGEKADSLERDVLVKPEGLLQRRVVGETVELDQDTSVYKKTIQLKNTNEIVKGSRRVEVKVTGDVMGPTVDGLSSLIQMPTGCGEQNMITLVPNIVVYIYLSTVNRLTNDIKEKAINFMKSGYQRELQYLRKDGSYSAFGESDESGSTWLTAFVMKSFSQARRQITVDPQMMQNAFTWLMDKQDKSGNFQKVGHIHHQEMLGGSGGGKALTAFIFIALKESESFLSLTQQAAITKTQAYLEGLVTSDQLSTTYELAIVAYALSLADSQSAQVLLEKLEGRTKPWETTTREPEPVPLDQKHLNDYRMPRPSSADIETWSYVLLAHAHKKDLSAGRPIMKWLLTQQNGFGGFMSTQDTVLGLQSLAAYAALAYSAPQTDISLTVKANASTGVVSHTFLVKKEKLLLLQSHIFPADTTSVELSASGNGLAIVKVLWQYNTMKEPMIYNDKKIIGDVKTNRINDDLYVITTCFKSPDENLGMTLMNLNLQTEMSVTNVDELKQDNRIKRIDENADSLVLYYDNPMTDFQCANVKVQKSRSSPISNIQAASMEAVVYYEPDIRQEVLYTVEDGPTVGKCVFCGMNCPEECKPSSAPAWRFDRMLLAACICLLFSLLFAV